MLGPKGTGFLYVRKEFQEILQAYFIGAGGGADGPGWSVISDPPVFGGYAASAHRYYGGTQASGLYKGVSAAIDFMESIGMMNIHRRIKSLGKYAQDALLGIGPKIELLTPTEERSRCAVNGFRIKGVDSTKFFTHCMEQKMRIRRVPENGLDSLRVSTHIYNSKDEVDRLIDIIKKAV
jgi:L-cysteine/cystine lyase